jgi:type II secretory pathway component PulM
MRMTDKRGTGMNLFDRHDTSARQSHPRRRHAILFAVAVVVLVLAWLGFNALIRVITLD